MYGTRWRITPGVPRRRLTAALVVLAVLFAGAGIRLFQLQAFDTSAYAQKAANAARTSIVLPAMRGTITDRNGVSLAASQPAVNITADPTVIAPDQRGLVASVLAKYLGGSPYSYVAILGQPNTRFVYVAKKVPATLYRSIAEELSDAHLGGIYREQNPIRTYPNTSLAGNLVGFVNVDGVGGAGLEAWLNAKLAGTNGSEVYDASVYGRMPLSSQVIQPAIDGVNYQLTIDLDLQATVDLALQQAITKAGAKTGTLIVMNVKNGEVLAMADAPGYDPNKYWLADPNNLTNRAAMASYEPGSVQKVLTMASLLDAGLITPETQVVVPPSLRSGDNDITDDLPHGTINLNARGILAQSSNIGTTLLARKMAADQYFSYMAKFGLGARTGIELPGEASGILDRSMTPDSRDRAAFGQAISVTAIQEAAALAAAVNGGVYYPPTILKSAVDADGKAVQLPRRDPHRVISQQASSAVVNMMESVVVTGSNNTLAIPGYRLIGKTGTAERVDPTCGCYRGNTVSYASVGTAEDPSILTYLVLDQPTNGRPSGASQAAPTVRDLMRFILPRYGVPVSTTPAPKDPIEW